MTYWSTERSWRKDPSAYAIPSRSRPGPCETWPAYSSKMQGRSRVTDLSSSPAAARRRALRRALERLDPSLKIVAEDVLALESRIDLVAVDGQRRIVAILLAEVGEDGPALTRALAHREWLIQRLPDWLQIAPSLGADISAGVRALVVAPAFLPETLLGRRRAAPWLGRTPQNKRAGDCRAFLSAPVQKASQPARHGPGLQKRTLRGRSTGRRRRVEGIRLAPAGENGPIPTLFRSRAKKKLTFFDFRRQKTSPRPALRPLPKKRHPVQRSAQRRNPPVTGRTSKPLPGKRGHPPCRKATSPRSKPRQTPNSLIA